MIWNASEDVLTARYDKDGKVYHCEIEKRDGAYSLTVYHNGENEKTFDMFLLGNKTRDLVESAEKFLETP